jgi:hypothetical protein
MNQTKTKTKTPNNQGHRADRGVAMNIEGTAEINPEATIANVERLAEAYGSKDAPPKPGGQVHQYLERIAAAGKRASAILERTSRIA